MPPAIPFALAAHRESIESALRAAIGESDDPLTAACRYVLGWEDERGRSISAGGKRIRPALCLLAAQAFGGDSDAALSGAIAVELVHNFSLVHDEIQDHDPERHFRPTLWARLGEAQAINVGDYLYTASVRALTSGPGDPARRLAALAILNDAIARMISGQWQDIDFESRDDVTVDEYLAMVAGKSGALLAAPLEIGALLVGAPTDVARLIGQWGLEVGLAFQVQDDFLGTWGDPDQTGKSNTNDIARRKKTLPVVHGLADPDAAAIIRRTFGSSVDVPVAEVVTALEAAGAADLCRDEAARHIESSDALLRQLPLDEGWRDTFRDVARYLGDRPA